LEATNRRINSDIIAFRRSSAVSGGLVLLRVFCCQWKIEQQVACVLFLVLFFLFHSFPVTTFIRTACMPINVSQYQAFHTALFCLMFNLALTKRSQQRKTARHCTPQMKNRNVSL